MIGVVTDSSSDLPDAVRDELDVRVVPLTIRFGGEPFVDGVDLDNAGFWRRLTSTSGLPETAAPSAGAFIDAFDGLAGDGVTGIVVVALSSRLSATHQSAVIAAEQVRERIPVRVVDSMSVSMGLGLAVMAAAEAARRGDDLDSVARAALEVASDVRVMAALDTLEFLRRGGRIGGAQALIGGMLDVKPLIAVEDGVVTAAGRVRTRSKARAHVVEHARHNRDARRLAVLHGGVEDIDVVVADVRDAVGREVLVAELGPVVGTHTGPGTVGIAHTRT